MRRLVIPLSVFFILVFIPALSFSYLIVDTGQPPVARSGSALSTLQSLAVGFTLGQSHSISYVKGWMYGFGTLSLSIYGNDINVPDPSNMFYTTVIDIPLNNVPGHPPEWKGGENLDWILNPGTYWAAFEVMEGNTFSGAMPKTWLSEPLNAPTAVDGYPDYIWHEFNPYQGLGFRIEGNQVPVPGAAWLLGSGLLSLMCLRRKFKK